VDSRQTDANSGSGRLKASQVIGRNSMAEIAHFERNLFAIKLDSHNRLVASGVAVDVVKRLL